MFPRNGFGTTKVDGKPKKITKNRFSDKQIITMPPQPQRGRVKPNKC